MECTGSLNRAIRKGIEGLTVLRLDEVKLFSLINFFRQGSYRTKTGSKTTIKVEEVRSIF